MDRYAKIVERITKKASKSRHCTAGRIRYDSQFTGKSAYVVVMGIGNLSRDSDEVATNVFNLTKTFRRYRKELDAVGLDTTRMKTHFTRYTLMLEMPFSGIIDEAEPVLKSVLKKVR